MKPLFHLVLGMPLLLLGLSLSTGSLGGSTSFLGESIGCTQGGSLLFWIPVAWSIGLLTHQAYCRLASLLTKKTHSNSLTIEQQAIDAYIQKATQRGLSQSQITTRLRAKGWSQAEIEEHWQADHH